LAGAQGILVNVTAGMDLSIGEFQEVGNVVKQFASDDATVVVGTVIDPDMANQIRVTVVATGLGKPVAKVAPQPVQAHNIAPPLTMRMVRPKTPMGPTDYAILDKPTVQRQRAVGDGLRGDVDSEDLLDIPAFLRRQAD
jgi:cell division protein FtsZ